MDVQSNNVPDEYNMFFLGKPEKENQNQNKQSQKADDRTSHNISCQFVGESTSECKGSNIDSANIMDPVVEDINVENSEILEANADHNSNSVYSSANREQLEPFKFELIEEMLIFQRMSFDYKMKCPRCKVETKYIIRHVIQSIRCQAGINSIAFKIKFLEYKKQTKDMDTVRQEQRERKAKSRARMRALDNEKVKKQQREDKEKSRKELRAVNHEKVKGQQRDHKVASRKELRGKNNEMVKKQQREHKEKSIAALRAVDNETETKIP